jgi:hypothetical protein
MFKTYNTKMAVTRLLNIHSYGGSENILINEEKENCKIMVITFKALQVLIGASFFLNANLKHFYAQFLLLIVCEDFIVLGLG